MVKIRDTVKSISEKRNQRLLRAQAVLRKLTKILINKYSADRIILIGSLADAQHFGFHSDIDLCVEGLENSLYFKAVGELLLAGDEFDVDLIPFENITPEMKEKVQKGKILYEKR